MYVSPAKQIFKCFACGAGGNVFNFIRMRENLSFPEAVERLADRAGIEYKPVKRQSQQTVGGEVSAKYLARANEWTLKFWQRNLADQKKGQIARDYIEQRQINAESEIKWGLGFAIESWDDLLKAARAAGITDKALLEGGLAVSRESGGLYDKFRNRLMFPIVDVTGRVIAFGGRTLGDDPAKYMNSPATVLFDKSNSMYGLDQARHTIAATGTAVVVEGYTDVIMCHQFGCENVVATLGTSFTTGHARILHRYAKKIVLIFDNDIAGTEAANRALEVCLVEKVDIKLAFVSQGKDPCDFMLSSGKEAFEKIVDEAQDVMVYKWNRLTQGVDGTDNMTDRRTVVDEYLRSLATAIKSGKVDAVARGLLLRKLSDLIGLSTAEINAELSRIYGRAGRSQSYAVKDQRVKSVDLGAGFLAKAQCEILEILLNEQGLYEKVRDKLTLDMFDVPALREIAEVLFEMLENEETFEISRLLGRIHSVETSSAVIALADSGAEKANFAERFRQAIKALYSRQQQEEMQKIKSLRDDDETEYLRKISQSLPKKNKRSPGMITG